MSPARPSTIGPYRLKHRLGAGGMGEVWRAWDERLHRSVAVKLIRPESAEDLAARERFRREARAAAALAHPAIVRIYDIIDSDEGDAIVMELVEGELLSQRIARGPLPVEEVVRLGRQIAEGLAAAHRRNILHRDLKAENVIVTPDGEAKVLDFGLAQRLGGEGEESLTRTGNIAGTFRTMSPEQVRKLPLDPRSDLFSFGVLLYEMLSCHSPFKGETALETLQGICSRRQVPAQELRPEIPSALSHLIDDLLEKETSFRPPSAQVAGARLEAIREELRETSADKETWVAFGASAQRAVPALSDSPPASRFIGWKISTAVFLGALLLLATFVLALPRFRRPPLVYVAFLNPEVTLGKDIPGVDLMVSSLSLSLESGLLAIEGVRPWFIAQRDQSSSSLKEVARATAASEIFTSQLSCGTNICQVSIHRLRAPDGTLLWTKTLSVPIDRPYLLADTLQDELDLSYPDRRSRGGPWLQVRETDYSQYLRLEMMYKQDAPLEEIVDRLARIRRNSPRFLDAWILNASILGWKFFYMNRDRRDLEHAYKLLEQAQKLAPHDPRPSLTIFDYSILNNELERAAGALAALERMQPGDDARLLANRALLLDRQGNSAQALALMRRATERLPSSRNLYSMARMEYQNGKMVEARATLQEFLRRSPNDYHSEYLLAHLEMFGGDPRKAAEIFRRHLKEYPNLGKFSDLGLAELLLGNLHQAEQSFRRAVALESAHSSDLLNLAETRLLLGDRDEADDLYRKTLRLAEVNPTAGGKWKVLSVRAQALAHLGRSEEAVAAIQEALRLAPNHPEVVYAASKVYALLGDKASALFNAKRALAQGRKPRWFNFPWFDPLRPALALRGLQRVPGKY